MRINSDNHSNHLSECRRYFNSVTTLVPPDTTSYGLNNTTVIPLTARKDDDGDSTFTIAGNLTGEWKDKYGNSIGNNLTQSPTICNAPYTLTLTTTGTLAIETQYGDNSGSAPNGMSGRSFAGPASMWDTSKGFLTQSTTSLSYGSNFPTTGANRLYFDLDIAGVASPLTWPSVTVGTPPNAIIATMSNITSTSVRVRLTGPYVPKNASTNLPTSNTAAARPTLPAKFELVGYSGSTPVVKYGFWIKKWYINRGGQTTSAAGHTAWCAGLNGGDYVIAKVKDLTNSNVGPSATPASSGNYYQRRIGGGLFSEWGVMAAYNVAGFVHNNAYWTSDTTGSSQFGVRSHIGSVDSYVPSGSTYGV